MSKNKIGEDSPILKSSNLKIRRRDGVESMTTLKEGEFKVSIDSCIRCLITTLFTYQQPNTGMIFISRNGFYDMT